MPTVKSASNPIHFDISLKPTPPSLDSPTHRAWLAVEELRNNVDLIGRALQRLGIKRYDEYNSDCWWLVFAAIEKGWATPIVPNGEQLKPIMHELYNWAPNRSNWATARRFINETAYGKAIIAKYTVA